MLPYWEQFVKYFLFGKQIAAAWGVFRSCAQSLRNQLSGDCVRLTNSLPQAPAFVGLCASRKNFVPLR